MESSNNITSKEKDNSEAISNLIQSIQSKLNNENLSSTNENKTEDISSCYNDKETSDSSSSSSNFDISNIISLLGKINNNEKNRQKYEVK